MDEPCVREDTDFAIATCHAPASSTYSMPACDFLVASSNIYTVCPWTWNMVMPEASHSTMWPKRYWQRPSSAPTVFLRRSGWYTQPLSWGLESKPLQQRYQPTREQRATQLQAFYTHVLTSFEAGGWSHTVDMLSARCSSFCEHLVAGQTLTIDQNTLSGYLHCSG